MHISTANLDLLLQHLNPEPDRDMYDLAVGVREITVSLVAALADIDSQLGEIKERLETLEAAKSGDQPTSLSNLTL